MPVLDNFTDNLDEKEVTRDIWTSINDLYGKISHLVNFKYNLLVYRLIRKHYVKIGDLEDATGLTKQRLYQIVNAFEEKEIERQNG